VAIGIQKTHPYRVLPADLRAPLEADVVDEETAGCLVRIALAGTEVPGLPMTSSAMLVDGPSIAADPLLAALVPAMGLRPSLLADPTAVIQSGLHREDLPAFVVSDVPAPGAAALGVRSLLVLGGGLPTGDLFFTWLLGREQPTEKSARFIRALTPAIKAALIPHALRPWGSQPP
jgi:hypothetical protein